MPNLYFYFKVANYIVIFTFICIILEFLYSYFKKDSVYTVEDTLGNFINAVIMKVFVADFGIVAFIGYLIFIKKYLPSFSIFSGYGVLSFITCSLIVDFTFYWWHRIHHYFEFLWMIHFVHHSDSKMNLSTAYRISFIEKITNTVVLAPAILLGYDPYFVVFCYYINSLYSFFTHSDYIKYPEFLKYIFIIPQTHIIHHAQKYSKNGVNFAIIFSIWDRMFGTYQDNLIEKKFGVEGYHQDNFIKIQTDPLVDYVLKLYKKLKREYYDKK